MASLWKKGVLRCLKCMFVCILLIRSVCSVGVQSELRRLQEQSTVFSWWVLHSKVLLPTCSCELPGCYMNKQSQGSHDSSFQELNILYCVFRRRCKMLIWSSTVLEQCILEQSIKFRTACWMGCTLAVRIYLKIYCIQYVYGWFFFPEICVGVCVLSCNHSPLPPACSYGLPAFCFIFWRACF